MKTLSDRIKIIVTVLFVLMMGILGAMRLMKIQVVTDNNTDTVSPVSEKNLITYTQSSKATRGDIIDCFGKPIVQNTIVYNIVLEKAFFPDENQEGNRILLDIYNLLKEKSYNIELSLPISRTTPYKFTGKEEDSLELKERIKLNSYATAENCIDKFISDYEISDKYSQQEKWIISAMRYELSVKDFALNNDFILAENVSEDIIIEAKAKSITLKGIDIRESSERKIIQGNVLPHEIGTVGPIYAEEYEELSQKGYAMNDVVGKSGIESVMEETLRGQNGVEEITVSNNAVVDSKVITPVQNGQTVKLTVDSKYQQKLQNILDNFLDSYGGYNGYSSDCGALVVLDAKTGAVRGMATAPTYDLNDYLNDYNSVLNAENTPLINRATDGLYRPGSTFKTITATGGLNEGVIDGDTYFYCGHTMTYYDMPFNCTGYHDYISVSRAITVSCNIFFYETAKRLTIDGIVKYENLYGLGQNTGIETGDSAGYIASPENYNKLGLTMYAGDVIQTGIGQGEMGITPLQLACVANTIANEGVRYRPYLVEGLYDSATGECVKKTEPVINATIELNYDYVYDYIEEGMIGAGRNMPYEHTLSDFGFDVAIKTGTPQTRNLQSQNSVFIGYAPADNPVLAFAGIIEDGEYSKYMIRDIIKAYDECYGISKPKSK
ncbi:MAG: penicillin-binding transpeptidase domain-containing protein [Ruminococcus sp.]|nr:penicillin-binding transpeptidase domain-containing protein [Oscillospiraceae bacterium]MDY4412888.1 penicillin-binding transpeptidase domain-containing protein [Ruminococcus sp.]